MAFIMVAIGFRVSRNQAGAFGWALNKLLGGKVVISN